jgi:hypothetical protein
MIRKNKTAQSSMEFLILMGFLTFVIIGILGIGYFYSGTINDRIKSTQISNFVNKITSTSEIVFYSGEPSKATISVHLPEGISDIEIINDTIIVTYHLTSGQNKASFSSDVPIIEIPAKEITASSGLKILTITANQTHALIEEN